MLRQSIALGLFSLAIGSAAALAQESDEMSEYLRRFGNAEKAWKTHKPEMAWEELECCPSEQRSWEWHFLRQRCFERPAAQSLKSHAGCIRSLAVHPGGEQLATAENDGSIALWQIGAAQPSRRLGGHAGGARALAYAPDGDRLASVGCDGSVRIWDTKTAKGVLLLNGHKRIVRAVSYCNDGRLASAGDDGVICLWDAGGRHIGSLETQHSVLALAFSPDGQSLAASILAGDIQIWSLADGNPTRKRRTPLCLKGHGDNVNCVVFSADGKRLASASNDSTVKLWDVGSGLALHTLRGHTVNVQAVAFSPDGKRLTSAGWDKSVKFWDTHTGQIVLDVAGATMINSIAFGPRGNYLAIAGFAEQPCIWKALP